MTHLHLRCAAKINLSLNVTGKRADGYHSLESVFQNVDVCDDLTIDLSEGEGIHLSCTSPGIPADEHNLAFRAAKRLLSSAGIRRAVHLHLQKEIPSGAGMGGGSADAAGVLYGLSRLMPDAFSEDLLLQTAVSLGADVPFFLTGGTAFAEGIGEKLTPLPPLPPWSVVILKGRESLSTPEVFRAADALSLPSPDTAGVKHAVETRDFSLLCHRCGNALEAAVTLPDVARARSRLLACGARCAVMTGSGAAVFGLFSSREEAARSAHILAGEFDFARATTFRSSAFDIVEES